MPHFPFALRGLVLSAALALSACGGSGGSGNGANVELKDMEKVDGTINDAMTDLDGVQAEGTAMAPGANVSGASNGASATQKEEAGNAASSDEEVVADQ